IRAADLVSVRPSLESFPLENEIALPLRIDCFATHEDNVRVYRFLAAQLAGRREFGTYDITLPADAEGLVTFLRGPQQSALLEALFLLAEGFRIAANLTRAYAGLAREQRVVAQQMLARYLDDERSAQSTLFDTLFAWLLSGSESGALPSGLRSIATLI